MKKKFKEFLEEKIGEKFDPKSQGSFYDTLTDEKINDIFCQIREMANKEEKELKNEIKNY